jgi:hypothetical protein
MVYKYRRLDHYTKDSIKNNTIYFSNPLNFNDPLDTLINFYFEGDYDLLCKKFFELGVKDYKGYAKALEKHNNFNEICKDNPHIINLSISCFSEEYDNILMWSHYADNHKGICLEYKTVSVDEYNCLLFDDSDIEADYPVPMLKVKYFVEQLNEFLSTKNKIWEYENEIRCIMPNSKFKNYPNAKFKKNVLSGVIFGLKTDETEKIKFKELVNSFHENVTFYSMTQIPNEYKLKITKEQ